MLHTARAERVVVECDDLGVAACGVAHLVEEHGQRSGFADGVDRSDRPGRSGANDPRREIVDIDGLHPPVRRLRNHDAPAPRHPGGPIAESVAGVAWPDDQPRPGEKDVPVAGCHAEPLGVHFGVRVGRQVGGGDELGLLVGVGPIVPRVDRHARDQRPVRALDGERVEG